MVFSPNDSPLAGREGSHLTGSKIGERLANEAATSVSLRVLPVKGGGEAFEVQARGELQLGLLIGASLCRAASTVTKACPGAALSRLCQLHHGAVSASPGTCRAITNILPCANHKVPGSVECRARAKGMLYARPSM